MNATALKLIVKFWHDDMAESPNDYDGWKAYSFSTRHSNHADPDDVGFEYDDDKECLIPGKDLQAKLDSGLAFLLSYFEHGQCQWSLAGEGPQCRWDSVTFAGILVWEEEESALGPKTKKDREKDARAFISNYTAWCNGYVYGFTIDVVRPCGSCGKDEEVDDSEHDIDATSCGGFTIDSCDDEAMGYMLELVKENIGSDWADYEVAFEEQNAYGLADEAKRLWKGE